MIKEMQGVFEDERPHETNDMEEAKVSKNFARLRKKLEATMRSKKNEMHWGYSVTQEKDTREVDRIRKRTEALSHRPKLGV